METVVTNVNVFVIKEPVGKLKATARVVINDCLLLTSLRLYEGAYGLFVAYPNDPMDGQDYRQLFYPLTRKLREHVEERVIERFNELLQEQKEFEETSRRR